MSRFVLIPGAGGAAWYWSRVLPLLHDTGHEAVAVDLPGDDASAGLPAYAELVEKAAAGGEAVVLVAGSLGGFTAGLVAERVPLSALVFVNAMIPAPGETAGEWWGDVGAVAAREQAARERGYPIEFDEVTYFLHDLPADVIAEADQHKHDEAEIVFTEPCAFTRWPDVPIRAVAGADDRLFPLELQRQVVHDRLGVDLDVLAGGHLLALANPRGVADYLLQAAG